jgi:ribosomal-protein-alanine N-acetyltransferase
MSRIEHLLRTESNEIQIYQMAEHDLSEVVALEEKSGLSRWGWEAYYQELHQPQRTIMLVTRFTDPDNIEYRLSGFVAARVSASELHVNNIAVLCESRSTGLGGALLDAVIEEGRRRGATVSVLEVRMSNIPAIRLYSSRGYAEVGRRKNYYSDPTEDAIVMKRFLGSSA